MLEIFKNIHRDRLAIIACNGPTLNETDMDLVNGNVIFALNRGYLKKDMDYTYLISADKRIENGYKKEIINANGIKFCHTIDSKSVVQYRLGRGRFSTDITKGMRLGHSVTIVALQIAYYMGCNPVYIIGMNHKFTYDNTKKHSGKQYDNKGKDINHFTPDYYEPGYIYRYQNFLAVEHSCLEARMVYEADGRNIYNLSVTTHLPDSVFPRVDKIY